MILLLYIILSFFASFFSAFVLTKLWGWFILPTFGWTVPSFWMAYGLIVVFGFFFPTVEKPETVEIKAWASNRLYRVVGTASLSLLFGWIVARFLL